MTEKYGDKIKVIQEQMRVLKMREIRGYNIDSLPHISLSDELIKEIAIELVTKAQTQLKEIDEYAKNKQYWKTVKLHNPFVKSPSKTPPPPVLFLGK